MGIGALDLTSGTAVVVYLQGPKEKIWGVLLSLTPAGVVVRGLDLAVFDDWMRQEARGEETALGPATIFYPMGRLVRMERDESLGPLVSYADRFFRAVGRTALQAAGVEPAGRE
ncbi:MAG: hypothetical protein DMF80_14895 [Acidobacteria bacterium]|nr:MAG: hypothetical protein DMF80_14895 [Acidobacteriota bacterium]